MRYILLIVVFSSLRSLLWAQESYAIKPLFELNSTRNERACSSMKGKLIVSTGFSAPQHSVIRGRDVEATQLHSWNRGLDYSDWTSSNRFFKRMFRNVESVTFNTRDSVLFFSSTENHDGAKGTRKKIYATGWNGKRWTSPTALAVNDFVSDFDYPHYVPSLGMLIFSSNRQGGQGGMDIWYMIQTDFGWSEPVNLGLGVNSPADELFPTFHNGDIYYATNAADTWGGFDIRRAIGTNQWKIAIAEGAPINSAADDVCLLFLNEDKAVLTSNRAGGKGADDLYLITREPRFEERHTMTAAIECAGQPLTGRQITVFNQDQEVVCYAVVNALGVFDISMLRIGQVYTFKLEQGMEGICNECLLVLRDLAGNRLKEVRFNSKGRAELELLPFKFSHVNPLALEDGSILNLSFEGQLYKEQPGDVGKGEPITIFNSKGEAVAIAYTNDSGKFRFTRLNPQIQYAMRLSPQTEAKHAIITDKGEKIDLPVLNAEVEYSRMKSDEAITLVNEYYDSIQVSAKDLFVINRIYYDFNSAELTRESYRQMDQLAIIMELNRNINLELRSHTDSRGDATYNLKLSQRRAESAVRYIISKGIAANRFRYEGMGEAQLINECADATPCSEPEHAINRRTEIRLTQRTGHTLSER